MRCVAHILGMCAIHLSCVTLGVPGSNISFVNLMEHARKNRLWNWFRPHPANLCHLDVFLAVELFVFAEAESRGFLSDDVLRCPNMMSLSSLLRPVTSTTSDMDDTRYEEAKKIMKNGFGECRDVTEHLHRLLRTSSGGSNEALKAMHAVTTVASAARQPWHIPCPCPLPDLRWRTVNAINIAPAGWYETDKPEAMLTKFTSVAQAVNFFLGTRITSSCSTKNCTGTFCWEAVPTQYLPPLLVVLLPPRSPAGYVVPNWDAPSQIFGGATYDLVAVSEADGAHYTACLAHRPLGPQPDWYLYDDMVNGGKLVPVPIRRGADGGVSGPGNIRRGYYPRALHYVARTDSVNSGHRVPIHVSVCRDSLTDAQLRGHHQSPYWQWGDKE